MISLVLMPSGAGGQVHYDSPLAFFFLWHCSLALMYIGWPVNGLSIVRPAAVRLLLASALSGCLSPTLNHVL